jgi:hypothetical protein
VGLVCGLLVLTSATSSWAVGVTVEVTDAAESLLDSRLARRLIALELSDVELPTSSDRAPSRVEVTKGVRRSEVVFVRLLGDGEVLTVELWAQGKLAGERRIGVAGTEELQARRVALACAELARHLREARLGERQRILREHLFPSVTDGAPSYSVSVSLGVAVSTRAAWLPVAQSALIGPRIAAWVRSQQGFGLELEGGYYHAVDSNGIRFWAELGLRPSWAFALSGDLGLTVGPSASVALVDVGNRSSVVGAFESQQTWSAKTALNAVLTYRLAPRTNLTFGPEVGLQLRDVHLEPRVLGPTHLRGAWIGFGLGAEWFL